MFDLSKKNEDLKSNVLDELFECREENVCTITKYDREKIDELTKDNDSYKMLIGFLDETIKDNKAKDTVKNSLESYIDSINVVGAYENEKFYKIRIFRCYKFNNGM